MYYQFALGQMVKNADKQTLLSYNHIALDCRIILYQNVQITLQNVSCQKASRKGYKRLLATYMLIKNPLVAYQKYYFEE